MIPPDSVETPLPSSINRKSHQVLENQLHLSLYYGFEPPRRWTREKLTELVADDTSKETFIKKNPRSEEVYKNVVTDLTEFRHNFAIHLEYILNNPSEFLGDSFEWRPSQKNALEGFIWSLRNGYQRFAFEMPTGGGKSHLLGAVTRAHLDTLQQHAIVDESEIILLTSRQNLVEQLMGNAKVTEVEDENEIEEGEAINIGDVRMWIEDLLSNDEIRILAGNKITKGEKKKNAALTIQTYQGFTAKRIQELHKDRMTRLVLLDEAHNVTERVRMLLNEEMSSALVIGGSATLRGPGRDPFIYFEDHCPEDGASFEDRLSAYESMANMINRGELKQLRWLEGHIDIDLSKIKTGKSKKSFE